MCGGRPPAYNQYGYQAPASTGCCGPRIQAQPYPLYQQQVPHLVTSQVRAAPMATEVIETITTAPTVYAPPPVFAPPPHIISAPAPIYSPPPIMGPPMHIGRPLGGTMISGPTISGPPIGFGGPGPMPFGVGGIRSSTSM